MEAATIHTKKTINKGKLKKTIKNVLCRPDTVFWPSVSEGNVLLLEKALNDYKIDKPHFEKLHWNHLKQIPKEKRPKPLKIKKVEGLIFGISECYNALKSNECAAVIIEAFVNPRIIVQPILDACIELSIPVICVNNLRTISFTRFNIPTSCLGIKSGWLPELYNLVSEIAKDHKVPKAVKSNKVELMETTLSSESDINTKSEVTLFPYLHRTDKKSRVFVPNEQKGNLSSGMQTMNGQDFIKIKENSDQQVEGNSYMKMIVKRISNNPNRAKCKTVK